MPKAEKYDNGAMGRAQALAVGDPEWPDAGGAERFICPEHGIADCSPLLNGCNLVILHYKNLTELREKIYTPDTIPAELLCRICYHPLTSGAFEYVNGVQYNRMHCPTHHHVAYQLRKEES